MYKITMKNADDWEYTSRQVLTIETEDGILAEHTDGGEPEDRLFLRDWNWVKGELERAYVKGLKDAKESND